MFAKRLLAVLLGLSWIGCANGESPTPVQFDPIEAGSVGGWAGSLSGGAGWPSGGSGGIAGSAPQASGGSPAASGGSGGTPALYCDPRFSIPQPTAGQPFTVKITDTIGYVYVDLLVSGPGAPKSSWIGVTGNGPYTWSYGVTAGAGVLDLSFVKDKQGGSSGTLVAHCSIDIASGGGGSGGGAPLPTCGQIAQQNGWANANCEWNGNGACNGQGPATSDCNHCCQVGGPSGGGGSGGTIGGTGFGFPVGDKSTAPAGGWSVWQVLSHYWSAYGGRHLAEDISLPGGTGAIDAPVYSVADGVVLFAKPNSSEYKNVLLIKHDVGDGTKVCSFYGHINTPLVSSGSVVSRGQQVATVKNWAECASGGSPTNTHLHYVLLNEAFCNMAANSGAGSGVCGYDKGGATSLAATDLTNEPFSYTTVNDACGSSSISNAVISPSKFIAAHHF